MDVLDFAMEMDRRGRDFYRFLARRASRPGTQRVFDRMAEEEERLLEGYRRMRIGQGDSPAETALLSRKDNPFDAVGAPAVADELTAYRLVVEMERKVCTLLERAAGQETDPSAKDALSKVAAVECAEMEEMEKLFDFINAPNEYLAWGEFSNLDDFHNFGRFEDNRGCGHTA